MRAKITGGTYFFTLVTHHRRSFLCEAESSVLLRESFRYVMARHPFAINAAVILPEHLHCIWTLPEGDSDYSMRWRLIKSFFSRRCGEAVRGEVSVSRRHKKEQAVWQRRFWEHCIRDEQDWMRHVEYIHYNPVRHGLVKAPRDWKYSSFHRYVWEGKYDVMWGRILLWIWKMGLSESFGGMGFVPQPNLPILTRLPSEPPTSS